jgi:hypothetical protein
MEYGKANPFVALISEDGTIYETNGGRARSAVGVDLQREGELLKTISDMQETLDNWYPKMVEHGYIVPEKTAADIAREQAAEQAEINRMLIKEIKGLKSWMINAPKNNNGYLVVDEQSEPKYPLKNKKQTAKEAATDDN